MCIRDRHQSLDLIWPAVIEHVVDAGCDAVGQRGARIHQKIARAPTGMSCMLPMQFTHTPTREQRDLDGAKELRFAEMRAARIEQALSLIHISEPTRLLSI